MIPRLQTDQIHNEQELDSKKRTMSTVEFPYNDLVDSQEVARAIFEHVGYTACSRDHLSVWLNHGSVNSGSFRSKISAARLFGLIEVGTNTIKLTQLGYDILDPNKKQASRVQAFLNVPLYSKLYERLKSRTLPNDVGLESEMVDLGVTPKQKAKARQAFQRSAEQAGFFAESPNRLVMPTGITPLNEDSAPREKPTIKLNPPPPPLSLQQNDHGGSGGGGGSDETQKLLEHPLVLGLFQDLARTDVVWTQAQHDEWLELAKLVLKRIHPIKQQGTNQ